ncbi:RNA polymerase sigma factor YlaC [Symmachiella dynata]|uniref:RNA polymerase sigma factor YlaC n=2 Tax=Symmachiella dynata TaxID=2527995 RepID=A0A517ZK40_9PLAN|nr:sigma-70 family RNA polymerase sigma factor [Symmachiella dynata]QDT47303.1 RNA polymerase sigma factor YlaC [Symmachiella dynata]QDU42806.1 RNA polymerase sigma factor YlaC [Symmachiella dynata]
MDKDNNSQLVELLNRARGGDEAARDELFDKCRNYLAIVARVQVESWLRVKVDASDLVQQTMLDAYRGFGDFRGNSEGEWLTWLKQILKHNATDFVRRYRGTEKRQQRREVPMQVGPTNLSEGFTREPSSGGESPSELVMQREREIQLADCITKLAPDHQEVIILRSLQRLPFDEVAERMDRTRPAVQMLWARAVSKLKDLYGEF